MPTYKSNCHDTIFKAQTQPCVRFPNGSLGPLRLESHPGTRNLAPERLANPKRPPLRLPNLEARANPILCALVPTAPPGRYPVKATPGPAIWRPSALPKPTPPPPAKFKTARESNLVCAGPTAPPGRCPVKATPGPSNLAPEAHPGAREPHPGALPTLGRTLTPRALPRACQI